jgi:hypothetical protein
MEIWRLLNKGLGLRLGHANPAVHPRLVLKGSHFSTTRDSGWAANSVPTSYLHLKVHSNRSVNNKPGSHPDYAHHEVLYRNACLQVITLISCGTGYFNKDVPHNVLQMAC